MYGLPHVTGLSDYASSSSSYGCVLAHSARETHLLSSPSLRNRAGTDGIGPVSFASSEDLGFVICRQTLSIVNIASLGVNLLAFITVDDE